MKAFTLYGPRDLRPEDRPEPEMGPDDVLIDVRRTGICGSDIHYYNHFRIGDFIPQRPLVLGHEFAGKVIEVGKNVTSISVGDRVTAEPSIECRQCSACRSGRYNLCTNLKFIGTAATVPHIDGGFSERVAVPARKCYVLSEEMDYGAGALAEPLAVGAHGVMRAGTVAGNRVLITGGGTIGQMVLAMVSVAGATDITVADPDPFAREFALSHGARYAVDSTQEGLATELYARGGYDVVFEAAGAPAALNFGYAVVARGGRLVQIGTQPDTVTLPANLVMSKELNVIGSFRYAHVFPMVLDLMKSGRVNVADLVSAVYPFGDMQAAMDRAVSRDQVVKVQVSQE